MTNADFTKRSVIFITIALAPLLIWLLFDVVLMFVGALLVANLLELGARPFLRFSASRPVALLLSGVIIVSAFAGAVFLFGAGVASELQDVLQRIEQARDTIGKGLRGSPLGEVLLSHIKSANVPVVELLGGLFRTSLMFVLSLLVTIFAGIYIAAQSALYRQGEAHSLPPSRGARSTPQLIISPMDCDCGCLAS
ncbi:MAG: AI-2E family transporter [Methylocystis sp.]|uniref:AI-2E family transporter n=1 Tax=Methylocystis sp. TaxID=1911079 RepID=UPI003DA4AF0C